MLVQAYVNFDGRCEEAIEFYKKALGAKVGMIMRYKDSPDPNAIRPGVEDKIMHSSLTIGETEVMASDGRCDGKSSFHGIMLSLDVDSDADATRYFDALSEGGKVTMPLSPTFYASSFGMLQDKFGVSWMVIKPLER